jgi:hypothetical protein
MKKIFTVASVFALLGIGAAKAQVTGTTNVHVKLADVLALSVNNADVNINFLTTEDYQKGVSVPMSGHLTVTSNKPYSLNIKAAGPLNGTGGNADALSPSVLHVTLPTNGNNTNLGVVPTAAAGLTTANAPLLSAATPAVLKAIDVNYAVPSSVSTTSEILGKKSDTYTTVVTYTVTQ